LIQQFGKGLIPVGIFNFEVSSSAHIATKLKGTPISYLNIPEDFLPAPALWGPTFAIHELFVWLVNLSKERGEILPPRTAPGWKARLFVTLSVLCDVLG